MSNQERKLIHLTVMNGYQQFENAGLKLGYGGSLQAISKAAADAVMKEKSFTQEMVERAIADYLDGRVGRQVEGLFVAEKSIPSSADFINRVRLAQSELRPKSTILGYGNDGSLCGDWSDATEFSIMRTALILGAYNQEKQPREVLRFLAPHCQRFRCDILNAYRCGQTFGMLHHEFKSLTEVEAVIDVYREFRDGKIDELTAQGKIKAKLQKERKTDPLSGGKRLNVDDLLREFAA